MTTCNCDKAHVRKVVGGWLLGKGPYWLAARPGDVYLVGHGWHFYTWKDAIEYATKVTA